jgi:hypothetical protein
MTRTTAKWFLRQAALFIVVIALLGDARPVFASDPHCFTELAACYQRAANEDSWGAMWLAGLDCELGFAGCLREALLK